jgi:hypothetical protein
MPISSTPISNASLCASRKPIAYGESAKSCPDGPMENSGLVAQRPSARRRQRRETRRQLSGWPCASVAPPAAGQPDQSGAAISSSVIDHRYPPVSMHAGLCSQRHWEDTAWRGEVSVTEMRSRG